MQDGSVSPIKAFFRNKWVRLILVLDVIAIIFIVVLLINEARKTAVINFMIAPVDATISINGKDGYRNGGQAYSFAPGTYEVQIFHDNLDTKTFILDLEADHNVTVSAFLSNNGDFEFYELRDNFSSFEMLAKIASADNNQTIDQDTSAEAFIANFQKNYNLYSTELPVTYSEYDYDSYGRQFLSEYITIRENAECNFTLCLEAVISNEEEKNQVKDLLKNAGFNLEDFKIEYRTY